MPGKKSRETELRWREILKRHADCHVSIREFCATEGISEPSFYAWRRRLRKHDGARPRQAGRPADEPSKGGLFVPLRLLDAAPMLEIVHPLGCRVQVSGEVDPVTLRRVIEALDEGGAG